MDLKEGDIVQLKSGGASMTVESTDDLGGYISCVWFDGKKAMNKSFAPHGLKKVEE